MSSSEDLCPKARCKEHALCILNRLPSLEPAAYLWPVTCSSQASLPLDVMNSRILSVITLYGQPFIVLGGHLSVPGGTLGTRLASYMPSGALVSSYSMYLHRQGSLTELPVGVQAANAGL